MVVRGVQLETELNFASLTVSRMGQWWVVLLVVAHLSGFEVSRWLVFVYVAHG